jgi:uncharacterized membrane protein YtjA (UPF0391 family)
MTWTDRSAFAFTGTADACTGLAPERALCGTAVTAPGASRLTYRTFVVLMLVMLMLLTIVVLVTFTRLIYAGLER